METGHLPPLVLIADPDFDTRFLFGFILGQRGFQVADTPDGLSAVEAAMELMPDLLITEISLPGEDGFAVCARLREDPQTKGIPILAVTGYWRPDVPQRAADAGINEILRKPCTPEDLLAAVDRVISSN